MKYIWVLLLSAVATAQITVPTPTPNIGLTKFPAHYNGWDAGYNSAMDLLDQFLSGGATAPGFKTNSVTVPGQPPGLCAQWGAGGLLDHALLPCNQNSFTFSGSFTNNLLNYDPSNFTGGAGTLLCKDANGNAVTTGCSTAGGGAIISSPGGGVNQTVTQAANTTLSVNLFEQWVFADQYAPSSSGGINEAFAACPNSGKCRVWAGIGTITACNISIPANSVLSGHGRNLTVLQCGTASSPVIADMASNSLLENLTVQHSSSPVSGGDGVKTSGDRLTIRNVKSINNYEAYRLGGVTFGVLENDIGEQANDHCIMFDTSLGSTTMQWIIVNGLFQKCAGWGASLVNATATNYTAPRFTGNTHMFANHLGGIRMSATSTGRIDNFQLSGCNLSQNDGDSVLLDTNGFTNGVTDCHIEQSGGNLGGGTQAQYGFNGATGSGTPSGVGNGIHITSNCDTSNGSPYLIANNRFYQDSDDSILVACDDSQVIGNNIYDPGYNHAGGGAANVRAGIAVQGVKDQVTGNFCQQGGTRSLSCIDISTPADKPALTGNSYGAGYTDATLVSVTNQPLNGFREFIGNVMWIQQNAGASGSCVNGSIWTRTDATGGWYLCVNSSWVPK